MQRIGSWLGHRSEPGLSSPCEQITVWCPCGSIYNDWHRASINLSLDHFDDEYVERISSTTCPTCGLKTRLSTLLSQFENDRCTLKFRTDQRPAKPPIVLYRARPLNDQPKAATRIKDWIESKGRDGIAEIIQVLHETQSSYYLDPLSEIVARWMMEKAPPQKFLE